MSTAVSPPCLVEYISSYLVLLVSRPCLAKVEAADVLISFGCLEPPFAKVLLHSGRFHLLLDEVDLSGETLVLLVHQSVSVDLSHKPPIVGGELVEGATEGSKGGTTPHQRREKPNGECSCWVIVVVVIVLLWGVE